MEHQTPARPHAVCVESGNFDARLDASVQKILALWRSTPAEMPEIGPEVGFVRRWSTARASTRLIEDLTAEIEALPEGDRERTVWRSRVRERIQQFGQDRLGWPDGYRRLLFGDEFYECAVAFARDARAFDPALPLEHVGQALRNVWIGNSFQMLLDLPVKLRPGLFAYSMLYPVTDNWLDDPGVSTDAKRAFNDRLGRRLAGLPVNPADERDTAVGRLVERIEDEFPRERCPFVYAALLAIHDGQMQSLAQHGGIEMCEADLAAISVRKGGSSVLTDLYLVTEAPQPSEERFAFGYGVFLQLLDDLQDVETDLAARHETLFTRAARRSQLDEITARLACFIDTVLMTNTCFHGQAIAARVPLDRTRPPARTELPADRLDLIRRNCLTLLVASVAEHPTYFSRQFRRQVARQWPVSFRAYRRLRRRARARWKRVQASLAGRQGTVATSMQSTVTMMGLFANSAGDR